MTDAVLEIDYFTDVLCVWAWIAQRRVDELKEQFGDKVRFNYRYVDVFGDTQNKIKNGWADRGSWKGFAAHVQTSAARYDNAPVHAGLWQEVRPTTSGNVHLILKAAELATDSDTSAQLAMALRKAFFLEAQDISQVEILLHVAWEMGIPHETLRQQIDSGLAMAALLKDYQQAKALGIKGSPSFVMDNNRQTLYGNVGYRVLAANVEELLKHPADEASWC
jgi:predicted DsbA family dithiol-disulfide isomerase